MARTIAIAGVVVAALLVLAVTLLWVLQRQFIYFPDNSAVPPAADLIDGARDVRLTTSDGLELGGWYVPPASGDRNVTVLVANGNGGNRAGRADLATALAESGFAVLLFDYRGYGGNPGKPSEDGLARDARAAHRFLTEDMQVPPERLLYFGESLGTGVVTELATEHPPAGMLLRSPFTDLAALGHEHYPFLPVGLLLREEFAVADHVARVDVPTTVVYGTTDAIVPPEQSRRVAEAAAGPTETVVIEGAGHNDPVMFGGPRIVAVVEALAERAVGDR